MNLYGAAFLLPVGVMFYTAQGGLKGSYAAAWANTTFILLALVIFSMMIYASGRRPVGSIKAVYENLTVMAGFKPVAGNKEGSYLTMWSANGLIFGIINVIGNFGTVFVDQSYWQGAIGGEWAWHSGWGGCMARALLTAGFFLKMLLPLLLAGVGGGLHLVQLTGV
jgi:Na+/proline symporter